MSVEQSSDRRNDPKASVRDLSSRVEIGFLVNPYAARPLQDLKAESKIVKRRTKAHSAALRESARVRFLND
jgi:hypothetical protein